jgi:hypothetical protein
MVLLVSVVLLVRVVLTNQTNRTNQTLCATCPELVERTLKVKTHPPSPKGYGGQGALSAWRIALKT